MSDTPMRPEPIEQEAVTWQVLWDSRADWIAYGNALEAENAALRESIAADKRAGDYFVRKGMEKALGIVHNLPDYEMYRLSVEAAIRAAMEE